jgi:beta-lactamase superfamily II metal-dependent hydrolase
MTGTLSVTMFNVGFGDCFLVAIPTTAGVRRILFDCGRHKGGDIANQKMVDAVIAAATDPDDVPRIDLIVATHRHKDHISGFKMKGWDKVEVREVWMPWTEDPNDPNARGVVEGQVRAAAAALQAFAATTPALRGVEKERQEQMAGVVGLALTNEAAMDTLYHGFSGKPERRYLPDRVAPQQPLTVPGMPGMRFHVMGPPRAEATMGIMDPPKAETFKRFALAEAAANGDGGGAAAPPAFAAPWILDKAPNALLNDSDQEAVRNLASSASLTALSAAIDNAINNTSLVIMVEVGSAFLLFCADAQWGNWQTILAEPHWCDMIGKTTFLKVGHHASHNASPVTLIDKLLPNGIPAMISVDPAAYNNVPYPLLLGAFTEHRYQVARSDEPQNAHGYSASNQDAITLELAFGDPA